MNTKQIHLAFASILLIAIAGVAFKSYLPQHKRIVAAETDAKTLTETLSTSDKVTMDLQDIESEIARIRARLKRFDAQLPSAAEIDKFLSQITDVAARNHLTLDLIKPGEIEVRPLYAEMPIIIEGKGRFSQFYQMLCDIQKMPRLTKVANLRFNADPQDPNCKVEMTLLIFLCRRGV